MRRILRTAALLLAVAAAGLAVFAVPTLWGRPWSIEHFYLRVFLETLRERPMLLSQLRVLEPWGVRWHNDDLDDFSVAHEQREAERVQRNLRTLREYPLDEQTPAQRFSTRVLDWFLEILADGVPFQFHDFPLNQFSGVQTELPDFLVNVHQIHDERDARDYLARLGKAGVAIDQVIDAMRFRMARGIAPPQVIVERVRADVERFLAIPPAESPLVTSFDERLAAVEGLAEAERAALVADARRLVETTVRPAWERLQAFLPELAAKAPAEVGAWALPEGSLYYGWALRFHTTTELDADAIHELGLREVERIHAEMREILAAEGYAVADVTTEAVAAPAGFVASAEPAAGEPAAEPAAAVEAQATEPAAEAREPAEARDPEDAAEPAEGSDAADASEPAEVAEAAESTAASAPAEGAPADPAAPAPRRRRPPSCRASATPCARCTASRVSSTRTATTPARASSPTTRRSSTRRASACPSCSAGCRRRRCASSACPPSRRPARPAPTTCRRPSTARSRASSTRICVVPPRSCASACAPSPTARRCRAITCRSRWPRSWRACRCSGA
jgi:hypothetical protein